MFSLSISRLVVPTCAVHILLHTIPEQGTAQAGKRRLQSSYCFPRLRGPKADIRWRCVEYAFSCNCFFRYSIISLNHGSQTAIQYEATFANEVFTYARTGWRAGYV